MQHTILGIASEATRKPIGMRNNSIILSVWTITACKGPHAWQDALHPFWVVSPRPAHTTARQSRCQPGPQLNGA